MEKVLKSAGDVKTGQLRLSGASVRVSVYCLQEKEAKDTREINYNGLNRTFEET